MNLQTASNDAIVANYEDEDVGRDQSWGEVLFKNSGVNCIGFRYCNL